MTYDQILSDIHKKNFAPIYFLTGEEPYFIDMISDTIENEALDEADRAFNQIVLYGHDYGGHRQRGPRCEKLGRV